MKSLLRAAFAGTLVLALPATALAKPALSVSLLKQDDGAPHAAQPIPPRDDLPEPDENGITTINWDHLLPDGEMQRIEELYRAADSIMGMSHFGGQMPQIGTFNTEAGLIGRTIRMPGFILPLHYDVGGTVNEFLLVPYFGACVHTPPPPPNQIVYVTTEEPVLIESMWDPVWVVGELLAERNQNGMGDAAYTLVLQSHEPY
ncbi:DUF3299 domain-containing protein [Hyphobacterium sp.]|uniref:DUF3299 domain-containing protein n=1 Tax=Hyphobacterium sp. TaxID=2004662 RepID=UPI0037484B7A